MLTRDQFLGLLKNEVEITKHLFTKLPKDQLNYRPTPGQRTLGEVLENLPNNLAVIGECVQKGDFSGYKADAERVSAAVKKDFCAALDAEYARFEKSLKAISDAELQSREAVFPNGHKMPLGPGLTGSVFRFFVSYKMQLFLYLKSAGRPELNSMNLWMGADAPIPQPMQK